MAESTTTPIHDTLTREPRKCFDDYDLVTAAALIRALRWAVLFAQSEPEFLDCIQTDPDTGKTGPLLNDEPERNARSLASKISRSPAAKHLLKNTGWTWESEYADWNTMLKHLPILTHHAPYLPLNKTD